MDSSDCLDYLPAILTVIQRKSAVCWSWPPDGRTQMSRAQATPETAWLPRLPITYLLHSPEICYSKQAILQSSWNFLFFAAETQLRYSQVAPLPRVATGHPSFDIRKSGKLRWHSGCHGFRSPVLFGYLAPGLSCGTSACYLNHHNVVQRQARLVSIHSSVSVSHPVMV